MVLGETVIINEANPFINYGCVEVRDERRVVARLNNRRKIAFGCPFGFHQMEVLVWGKPNGQPNEIVSPNILHLGMIAYWYKVYIRGDRKKKLVWFG